MPIHYANNLITNGRLITDNNVVEKIIDASKSVDLPNKMFIISGTIAEGVDVCIKAADLSRPSMFNKNKNNSAINGEMNSLKIVATIIGIMYEILNLILEICKPIINISSGIAPSLNRKRLFFKLVGITKLNDVKIIANIAALKMGIFKIFFIIDPIFFFGLHKYIPIVLRDILKTI
ncbi:MAG: hypothetical protein SVN78_06870 [Deferribacterota bacterium]|nr:hypothetical protein [Deferribacterota bacterium]